jgi:sugar O-acyltransferase (sialic acid O-acetyltransferase NeuD family)
VSRGIDEAGGGALRRVALWGASGHAKVVADAIRREAALEIVGFIDDTAPARKGEVFCGARVLGGREVLPELLAGGVGLMLVVGHNAARLAIAADMQALGFRFPVVVHPGAMLSAQCQPQAGTFVAAGAVVNADARIGAHAIINTGAVVDHDCVVGDGVHVGPRSCLTGWVTVGRGSWIGAGVVVRDRVVIGEGSIVGMGSVVLRDIPDGVVAYGSPARVIRRAIEESK